jgi:hypothetical protein
MNIFLGILLLLIGFGMVLKTEWLVNNFGRIEWFDKNLGTEGGTRLGYKFIGMIIIFIGILVVSGNSDTFFNWLLSPLINAGRP